MSSLIQKNYKKIPINNFRLSISNLAEDYDWWAYKKGGTELYPQIVMAETCIDFNEA